MLKGIRSNVHIRICVCALFNRVGVRSLAPIGLHYLMARPWVDAGPVQKSSL